MSKVYLCFSSNAMQWDKTQSEISILVLENCLACVCDKYRRRLQKAQSQSQMELSASNSSQTSE